MAQNFLACPLAGCRCHPKNARQRSLVTEFSQISEEIRDGRRNSLMSSSCATPRLSHNGASLRQGSDDPASPKESWGVASNPPSGAREARASLRLEPVDAGLYRALRRATAKDSLWGFEPRVRHPFVSGPGCAVAMAPLPQRSSTGPQPAGSPRPRARALPREYRCRAPHR
jgi:hypothetical protein